MLQQDVQNNNNYNDDIAVNNNKLQDNKGLSINYTDIFCHKIICYNA